MKKFLLVLAVMLLFSMTAQADVCANNLFGYVATATCGGYREYCDDCPPGCSDCHGVTVTWVCESGGVRSYADRTVSSCDVCFDGYELKESFTGSWEGEDNNTYRTVTRYMCEERDTPVCPSNCSSCSDSSTCTSCDDGYTLSNGECVKKPTCSNGQYTASDGTCQPCSNISVPNGSCLSCSSSSQCDNISCNTGYVKKGLTCVKAATCTYPLKEVTDYSGECASCCTD